MFRLVQRGLLTGSGDGGSISQIKSALATAGRTIAIFALCIVPAEGLLRLFHYVHPVAIFYDDSYNRFRGKPFAENLDARLNSRGFNDTEHKIQKASGTVRILGLGDSFAFGAVPQAKNYLRLLRDILSQGGTKAEVLNMGIPGTGPRDYLSLLIHEGLELQPDIVLVSFFVGNDFELPPKRKWYEHSYLASFARFAVSSFNAFEGVLYGAAEYMDDASTFTDARFMQIEQARSDIYRKQNARFERGFAAAVSNLVQIKEICERTRIRLHIVIIPDEVQVDLALQQKVVAGLGVSPDSLDFALPNAMLRKALDEHGIDHVDLLEAFIAHSQQQRLYKPNDTHWNIRGNALAAALISEHLMGYLPATNTHR